MTIVQGFSCCRDSCGVCQRFVTLHGGAPHVNNVVVFSSIYRLDFIRFPVLLAGHLWEENTSTLGTCW